ncbi:uncharacterized protein LOC117173186 [Belonocnema kinseyi]|uniref:uncharacterized protein LOC117173186 n=1 Tax=Belonocnema kinseyi TaxID=2817044 RepID=UPI00143D5650|nr:uncharacterized protein LOC117173186 [Belonocnema kinseyi]
MPDISTITHYPLKIIFAIHFSLVSWGIQGQWVPRSMMMYNLLFFMCLLWAIHNIETDEPLQFALFINVVSILFDVFALVVYFPHGTYEKFCAVAIIFNTCARIITSIFLVRIGRSRGGSLAMMFPSSPSMGYGRQEYEDISHPVPQNSDFAGI